MTSLLSVVLLEAVDCRISEGALQLEGEQTAGLDVFYLSQFAGMSFSKCSQFSPDATFLMPVYADTSLARDAMS
jgi:hypothetical protein